MRRVLAGVILMVVGSGESLAQDSELYDKCIKKADTQLAMNTCARDEVLRVDIELNEMYQRLLSAVGNQSVAIEKIRAAERAWIVYRDAYIDAMYPETNKRAAYGSMFPMEADLLRAKLTQQQIAALKALLKRHTGSR